MAFNLQTFRTRTLTAIIFAAVMLTGLLWNQWSFFILFSVIHFGCWIEYLKLAGLIDPGYKEITPFHKYGVMLAGWCIMLYFTSDAYNIFGVRLSELGWWMGLICIFLLPITEILFTKTIRLKNIGHSFFGLIYISLSWGLMMDLYRPGDIVFDSPQYNLSRPFLPLIIILSLWINDTMAYIAGSLIGKTPLSKISPKKTWEGTIVGIILSIGIVGTLARLAFDSYAHGEFVYYWYIISAIASITGTLGDLLESKLKRMAGVKDSGSLMPGHGGFLDRFDSLLLATPFVWLCVYFFIR
jgi:phosphatidate cytidylyltransferase